MCLLVWESARAGFVVELVCSCRCLAPSLLSCRTVGYQAMVEVENAGQLFTDVAGLSDEWDASRQLRDRLRAVGRLVVDRPKEDQVEVAGEIVGKTIVNVKHNASALKPLLVKMKGHMDKIVEITSLSQQIKGVFASNGLVASMKVLSDQT